MSLILIVEDDPDFSEGLVVFLRNKGFKPCAVRSGEEALEWLASHSPALVITDLLLPGMDGAEMCRAIRSAPSGGKVPIIMLTSMTRMGVSITQRDATWAPIDKFMDKAAAPEQVLEAVEALLNPSPE
ncbi:MAG: response regulator [Candidatus Hydrogenedentes bacterium]|nr:response regulator [Candidatus Hydrogenedentota bacterium]